MASSAMTKKVLLQFSSEATPEWSVAVQTKFLEMASAFKTDGLIAENELGVRTRNFKDQAAAQEWVDFITQLAATQNRGLESAEITDI